MGRPEENDGDMKDTFYEEKYRDPNGVIFDITDLGWGGAVKEVKPVDEDQAGPAQHH